MKTESLFSSTALALLIFTASLAGALPVTAAPETVNGRDIMQMVDDRPDGEDRRSELKMTLINRRGRKRVREVVSYKKDYGKDSKQLMFFKRPSDVKGTSFLSWNYDDTGKDDDKWLYMPALRKVRRISGKSSNDYFMGTDFTYDDMGDRNVDEDTHTLLKEENLDGSDCWVVESIPVDKEDAYVKKIHWIRKDALVIVKTDYYDKDGLMKTFRVSDLKLADDFWTIFGMEMRNLYENHKTIMTMSKVKYDLGIKDALFTVSTISRGNIR